MKKRFLGGKKGLLTAVVAVVCCFVLLLTAACGSSNKKTQDDTRGSTVKPNISTVYSDFYKQPVKGSNVDLDLTAKIFSKGVRDDDVKTAVVGQNIELSRDNDGEKYYAEGKAKTIKDANSEKLLKYILPLMFRDTGYVELEEYLRGESSLEFAVGAKEDYNLKISYNGKKGKKGRHYAVADKAILDATDGKAEDFSLLNLLMSEGLLDFGAVADWLDKDEANRFFSTSENRFVYQLSADTEKVKKMFVDKIKELIFTYILDDQYSVENFDKIMEYISGWIKVNPSSVKALVYESGLPNKIETECEADINIPVSELGSVLYLATGDKEKEEKTIKTVQSAVTLFALSSTTGEPNVIGLRVGISSAEKFRYGKECTFKNAEDSMFAGVDEDVEGRVVIDAEKIMEVIDKLIGKYKDKNDDSEQSQE